MPLAPIAISSGVPHGEIKRRYYSLAHRQSITIRSARGLTYTVSESNYQDDGYFTTPDEEETGAIVANRTQTAAFNNARKVAFEDHCWIGQPGR